MEETPLTHRSPPFLASFWCSRTNTLAFPWGKATITLQDITLLAGFPAHGAPVPAPLTPEWRPDEVALNGARLNFNRGACKKAHHSAWIKHFLAHDHAASLEHKHAAFLALWLIRFVLLGHPESTMRQSLFPIAVRLTRGEHLTLGPTVLASLYHDLHDIKAFLVATTAATTSNTDMLSSLSLYAPLYILQLWMWERFPTLRPGRENPLMDDDPMVARWHDLSRKINPTLIHQGGS